MSDAEPPDNHVIVVVTPRLGDETFAVSGYTRCPHCKETVALDEHSVTAVAAGTIHPLCTPCAAALHQQYPDAFADELGPTECRPWEQA